MRVLLVHPSPLMYNEIYLRLEPLGLERVAAALREANHEVRIVDLQIFTHQELMRELDEFRPHAVGFSLNYLANVPELIDLAKEIKRRTKECFVFAGGHSASFIATELLAHSEGALDCVLRGEGEVLAQELIGAIGASDLAKLPGVITTDGSGPPPLLLPDIDRFPPARDLTRRRHKYFISTFDPCATIEFTRGCPWDCSFCSAWTFYGRSYRQSSPDFAARDLESIKEPNVFIVDDVAFIHADHGMAIAHEIERRRIKKHYYLETRADVLCRNHEVFEYWRRLGLEMMFIGIEAMDEETLKLHRKRSSLDINNQALQIARKFGIIVAINMIVDPSWDYQRFAAVREWAMSIDEVVNLTVATPYPGTETWFTESRKLTSLDYRLFDIQHAVLPTRLPLREFYRELVKTQSVLNRKHLGLNGLWRAGSRAAWLLAKGQTNFLRMLWKFNQVYSQERQYSDHFRPVKYAMTPPQIHTLSRPKNDQLYVHNPRPVAKSTANA